MAVVILIKFKGKTIRQQVGKTPVTIGRSDHATVALDDDLLSKIHCSLYIKNEYLYVSDLDSKNGVYTTDLRQIGKDEIFPSGKTITLGNTSVMVSEESKSELLNFKRSLSENKTITQKLDKKMLKRKEEEEAERDERLDEERAKSLEEELLSGENDSSQDKSDKKAKKDKTRGSFTFKIDEDKVKKKGKKTSSHASDSSILEKMEQDQEDISSIVTIPVPGLMTKNVYDQEFYEGGDGPEEDIVTRKLKLAKKFKKGILSRKL